MTEEELSCPFALLAKQLQLSLEHPFLVRHLQSKTAQLIVDLTALIVRSEMTDGVQRSVRTERS